MWHRYVSTLGFLTLTSALNTLAHSVAGTTFPPDRAVYFAVGVGRAAVTGRDVALIESEPKMLSKHHKHLFPNFPVQKDELEREERIY